jgi:3-hydroxybutyryl-CoA dehydrogenase
MTNDLPSTLFHSICVCGAGTMGSGIAQVAAQSGFATILFDLDANVVHKAALNIAKNLDALVAKQKLREEQKQEILSNLRYTSNLQDCISDMVIEAIVEKEAPKIALFNRLAEINHSETIFATNTSSLSVSKIAAGVMNPHRVAGMHFFNPAPLMKLVEVVKAEVTSYDVIESIFTFARKMNKVPVLCHDSPGFIVNRVARHYYLEALRLADEKNIPIECIDDLMEASGFRMGPFRLMDLIGNDINLAVTQSVYEAMNLEPRLAPSPMQEMKVEAGELGRKSGKGYYEY